MTDISTVVSEGYKSLAERTLEQHEHFVVNLPKQSWAENKTDLATIEAFNALLVKVKGSGQIQSLTDPERISLYKFIQLLESSIPAQFKPQSDKEAVYLALNAVMAHSRIPTFEDFSSKTGISEIALNSGESGLAVLHKAEGPEKILHLEFDQQTPALSTIAAMHNLHYGLQPETRIVYAIGEGARRIVGQERLISLVKADPSLIKQWADTTKATHQLNFFAQPQVLELAARVGADVDGLKAYVQQHLHHMNFLTCYIAGNAYLAQTDILQAVPDFRSPAFPQPVLQAYMLMSLADTLIAPFRPPRHKANEVGIGMVEFMRKHPQDKDALMWSKEFHQALTESYFSNHA